MSGTPKRPAPWIVRWPFRPDFKDGTTVVYVLKVLENHSGTELVAEVDKQYAAVIACAPEMAALLRKHEWRYSGELEYDRYFCSECGAAQRDGHAPSCALAELLARMDGAKETP